MTGLGGSQMTRLPAEVDRAHERLSGPATRRIPKREFEHFGNQPFARLGGDLGAAWRRRSNGRGPRRCRSASGGSRIRKGGPII